MSDIDVSKIKAGDPGIDLTGDAGSDPATDPLTGLSWEQIAVAAEERIHELVRQRETALRDLRKTQQLSAAHRKLGDEYELAQADLKVAERQTEDTARQLSIAQTEVIRQSNRADQAWGEVHRLRSEINRLNGRRLSPHKLIRSWLNGGRS